MEVPPHCATKSISSFAILLNLDDIVFHRVLEFDQG